MDKVKEDVILKKYVMPIISQYQDNSANSDLSWVIVTKTVSYWERKRNFCSIVGLNLVFC